jgi:hypothetical protein
MASSSVNFYRKNRTVQSGTSDGIWCLQCFDMIYDGNDKHSGLPRGMPLGTRMFASKEHVWDPMASSRANVCSKTRTVRWFLLQRFQIKHSFERSHEGNNKHEIVRLRCLDAIYSVTRCEEWIPREECYWSYAWQRFKRSKGVELNDTPRV